MTKNFNAFFLLFFIDDAQQLLICNIRSAGTKRIFAIIGVISVVFVIVLFSLLSNNARENDDNDFDRHKRSTISDMELVEAYENGDGFENSEISHKEMALHRTRRQSQIDPNESAYYSDGNVRTKREHLQRVQAQFNECRQSQADPSKCERFYREMLALRQALNFEIGTLRQTSQNPPPDSQSSIPNSEQQKEMGNHKMVEWDDSVQKPFNEMNREGQAMQKVNEFTPFPRFHEEMDNSRSNLWTVDDPAMKTRDEPMPRSLPSAPRKQSLTATLRENEKVSPLKTQSFGKSRKRLRIGLACSLAVRILRNEITSFRCNSNVFRFEPPFLSTKN